MSEFTFVFYAKIIQSLKENGYEIADYDNYRKYPRTAILRHDIDFDIQKSVIMAEHEAALGVTATYYVLLRTDLYSVFSAASVAGLKRIMELGGKIGLHFDETCYPLVMGKSEEVKKLILSEKDILEDIIGTPVTTVSMHQPSRQIIEAELDIPGMINSYRSEFFREMKYVSDSCRNWREPVIDIIKSNEYDRIHILTHALWWHDEDMSLHDTLCSYINEANMIRYEALMSQVEKYREIMPASEVR
ncbi:MAG: hypothetical protein K6F73_05510 [Lachnospiraceae bacterium]|nr:hypothetical protein [Lachnospiraceae bacterium]